jgi:hypothetical protein
MCLLRRSVLLTLSRALLSGRLCRESYDGADFGLCQCELNVHLC